MDPVSSSLFTSRRIEKLAALFLLVASVFVAFLAVGSIREVFAPRPIVGNVISVAGTGKVTAVPDVAKISFSVSEDADTASEAQDMAAQKGNDALKALVDDLGIDEKDIKTTYYNVSPRYSRAQPCYQGVCPDYVQTIIGYTASQTIEVKVRDTSKVGDVLTALGKAGASNISGPNFTVDDLDALTEQARAAAVEDARAKAKELAKALGVHLSRVTGYWENSGPYSYDTKAYGLGGAESSVTVAAPTVPTGENEISVTVNVSFEIR